MGNCINSENIKTKLFRNLRRRIPSMREVKFPWLFLTGITVAFALVIVAHLAIHHVTLWGFDLCDSEILPSTVDNCPAPCNATACFLWSYRSWPLAHTWYPAAWGWFFTSWIFVLSGTALTSKSARFFLMGCYILINFGIGGIWEAVEFLAHLANPFWAENDWDKIIGDGSLNLLASLFTLLWWTLGFTAPPTVLLGRRSVSSFCERIAWLFFLSFPVYGITALDVVIDDLVVHIGFLLFVPLLCLTLMWGYASDVRLAHPDEVEPLQNFYVHVFAVHMLFWTISIFRTVPSYMVSLMALFIFTGILFFQCFAPAISVKKRAPSPQKLPYRGLPSNV